MFWNIIFLIAIVFVLTYDPKSRTLENMIVQNTPTIQKSCESAHYQAVQFGESPYECPTSDKTMMEYTA